MISGPSCLAFFGNFPFGGTSPAAVDVLGDGHKVENVDVQHLAGTLRRFEILAAVVPQPQFQTLSDRRPLHDVRVPRLTAIFSLSGIRGRSSPTLSAMEASISTKWMHSCFQGVAIALAAGSSASSSLGVTMRQRGAPPRRRSIRGTRLRTLSPFGSRRSVARSGRVLCVGRADPDCPRP
jgi:hypothetical protein